MWRDGQGCCEAALFVAGGLAKGSGSNRSLALIGAVRTLLGGDHLSRYSFHAVREIRAESGFHLPSVCSRIVARQDYALSQLRPVFGDAVKVPLERKHGAVKLHFNDERLTMP